MGRRDVLVLTGTRAEYGLLRSSMERIRDHDSLSLSVVATGMHLSPSHGRTVTEIAEDGFEVDREVMMLFDGDSGLSMAKSLGAGISGVADAVHSLDPDIVLVLGDRDEALAGALAAAHMNVPVAHIHGGDAMNGAIIDESIRHAITKFAHVHFPASEKSAERIRKMGEQPWRITPVGAPGLDDVIEGRYDDPEAVRERYDLDADRPVVVLVQHPVTTQPDAAGDQMEATLDALAPVDVQVVLVYPNSDAGGKRMIEVIEAHTRDDGDVRTAKNVPRREFLGLLATADVMVGNSSSGIIEAPSFGLPVVDIGPRQDGRERGGNVRSVPHDATATREAVRWALTDEARDRAASSDNPYDFGGASERICRRLANVDIDESLLRKGLTY